METRYDVVELKAAVSPEGWIRDKPVVTRAGIFKYRTPDGRVKAEYRPEEEVFHADSLASLSGVPITDGHKGLKNRDNPAGIVGTVLSKGEKSDLDVTAEIVVHDATKLGKKRELSMGYTCNVVDTPGEWNGEKYDSIQKNIRYNHLAVVEKGRAGNARLRLDHDDAASFPFDQENDTMADPKMATVRLDDIDYQAAPEVVNALKKAGTDTVALQKRFDTLEAERDSLKTKLADAEKKMGEVKTTARAEIQARLELEGVATAQKVKFDENDTDAALKVKILGKLSPSLKLDGKSEDYIASAFDLAVASDLDKNKKVSGQFSKFDKSDTSKGEASSGSAASEARDNMLRRLRGEKVEDKSAAA